jgi:broad specificity phosphatase PhoE
VALLYLVRHAEPAALWGAHPDPGLSPLGKQQAQGVGDTLKAYGVTALVSSPLARCRETALPLEVDLGHRAVIDRAVAEIPVPTSVTEHRPWLMAVMSGNWNDDHVDPLLRAWRNRVGTALIEMAQDTIVFSHFVAINAAVGLAKGSDQVTVFKPGHASVTVLSNEGGNLNLVKLGDESAIHLA